MIKWPRFMWPWRNQPASPPEAQACAPEPPDTSKDHSDHQDRAKTDLEVMLASLRPATVEDYRAWLRGFRVRGGRPTHPYAFPMKRLPWYVVTTPEFEVLPLASFEGIYIIVPVNVSVTGDVGGNRLYFMDGFGTTQDGLPIIPTFPDVILDD